jgi:hypothetical protein
MRRFAVVLSIVAVVGGSGSAPADTSAAAVDATVTSAANLFVPPHIVLPQGGGLLHSNMDVVDRVQEDDRDRPVALRPQALERAPRCFLVQRPLDRAVGEHPLI